MNAVLTDAWDVDSYFGKTIFIGFVALIALEKNPVVDGAGGLPDARACKLGRFISSNLSYRKARPYYLKYLTSSLYKILSSGFVMVE